MKFLLSILLLLAGACVQAQVNVVPNGNFEQNTSCPFGSAQITYCVGWSNYHTGTTDYFHTCGGTGAGGVTNNQFGGQLPASGNAYAGGIAYYSGAEIREYLTRTIPPLIPGVTYEVSMSVSLGETYSGYATNGLGVYFFDVAPGYTNIIATLPVTPQVSYASYGPINNPTTWARLSKTFVADSAYDNIVIGGFLNNSSSTTTPTTIMGNAAYYYIDSVVVKIMNPIAVNLNDSVFCAGDSIHVPYTLISQGPFSAGNVFTLQLSNASGSFATPLNIGTAAGTTAGTVHGLLPASLTPGGGYRVRVVSNVSVDSSLPGIHTLDIKPLPQVVGSSNSPLCAGQTLNLAANGTLGSTYGWSGPSFTSTQQNPSITNTSTAHSGDYIVADTLNGCIAKDTLTVLVKPIPATPTAGSNSPVCSGWTLNLTAASTTLGVTYNWNGPLSYSSTTQNPAITSTTTTMSGSYGVTATLNGCTSPAGTTAVTINLTPATPTAGSNSPVCAGGTLNLTASSSTPGVTYQWVGPNSFMSTQQNPVISPAPLNGGGSYSVKANLNGCSSGAFATTVVVNNVSSLGVYPSPNDTLCIDNANANFVAVPFNAGTAPQYQWYKNGNPIGGATSITYPAKGIADDDTFHCRITVTGLCADPLILYSNKVGMTVLPVTPGPSITITANPGTLLSPWQLVQFTAVATNAGTLPKYQWKRNGQDVLGATSNVWSANNLSNGDTIHCVVTSDMWCASPASEVSNRMVVNIKTGIPNIDANGKLELYPNPNNGSFIVYLPLPPSRGGYVSVNVVDALGRIVYTDQQSQLTNHQLEIQLPASIANGVYMLKLSAEGVVYHARFTVGR